MFFTQVKSVRVSHANMPNTSSMNIAEIEIWSYPISSAVNLARGSGVWVNVSSTHYVFDAGRAVDGILDSDATGNFWHSSITPFDANPWINVTLSYAQPVSAVNVYLRNGYAARDFGDLVEVLDGSGAVVASGVISAAACTVSAGGQYIYSLLRPSRTPTSSATPSPTGTSTPTASVTSSGTRTGTPTPTRPTPSSTASSTSTTSRSAQVTSSATVTASFTTSGTSSGTVSGTSTSTGSVTAPGTSSATRSSTASSTASGTSTSSRTASSTATGTSTRSSTRTSTASPLPSGGGQLSSYLELSVPAGSSAQIRFQEIFVLDVTGRNVAWSEAGGGLQPYTAISARAIDLYSVNPWSSEAGTGTYSSQSSTVVVSFGAPADVRRVVIVASRGSFSQAANGQEVSLDGATVLGGLQLRLLSSDRSSQVGPVVTLPAGSRTVWTADFVLGGAVAPYLPVSAVSSSDPTLVRFVRITSLASNSGQPLNILEVQAIEAGTGGNAAFGKNATASSVASDDLGPELAVDGAFAADYDANPVAMYHSAQPSAGGEAGSMWWQVDLGGAFDIRAVIIWNRFPYATNPDAAGNLASRLTGYKLQLLNAGGTVLSDHSLSGDPIVTIDTSCPNGGGWLRPGGSGKCFRAQTSVSSGYIEDQAACGALAQGAAMASIVSDAEADYALTQQCGAPGYALKLGAVKQSRWAGLTSGWQWGDGSSVAAWLGVNSTPFWDVGQPDDNLNVAAATTPKEAAMVGINGRLHDFPIDFGLSACCAVQAQPPASDRPCSTGSSADAPATSCYSAYLSCGLTNTLVWIRPIAGDTAYQAYCADDGWALAMKLDGNGDTFAYTSAYWTNADLLNDDVTRLAFSSDAKLRPFVDAPVSHVRLRFITPAYEEGEPVDVPVGATASSLLEVFTRDGQSVAQTSVDPSAWVRSVYGGANYQSNCNYQGFNAQVAGYTDASYRLGIVL